MEGQDILPFVYCYPPRTSYVEAEAPLDLMKVWALDAEAGTDLNVYVHIPFCRYRCAFCGLYNVTTRATETELHRSYVASLRADLQHLAPSLRGRRVRTVFIGGGTPLAIGTERLVELLAHLAEIFPDLSRTVEEVSVEASPDSVLAAADQLPDLVAAGVNRVSVGIQSFDPEELRRAGRASAGPAVIADSLRLLRSAGVRNIGTDLIVGLENQSDASMERSLDQLLTFRPETVSLYLINPRLGTGLGRRSAAEPQPRSEAGALYDRLEAASVRLLAAGYERETSVQFKLPGRGGLLQKRLYFDGLSVLGLGSGARSHTATVDYLTGGGAQRTHAELEAYLGATAGGARVRKGAIITPEEAERRAVILGLQDLRLDKIPRTPDGSFAEPYRTVFTTCLEMGLMRADGDRLTLTDKGFLYRDLICWSLFSERTLERHSAHGMEFPRAQRYVSAS